MSSDEIQTPNSCISELHSRNAGPLTPRAGETISNAESYSYQIGSIFNREDIEAEDIEWETWIDPESWTDNEKAFFWRRTCEEETKLTARVRERLSALLGVPACWSELMARLEAELSKPKLATGTGILLRVESDGTPVNTKIYDLRTGATLAASFLSIEVSPRAKPTEPIQIQVGFGNVLMTTFASFDVAGQDSEGNKYTLTGQGDSISARLRDEAGNDVDFACVTWRLNVNDKMADMDIAELDFE